jgi:hypothetical protein
LKSTGRSTSYWAGQSVRLVERIEPAEVIIEYIVGEFEAKYTAERNYRMLMRNYRSTLGREELPA